ncbi:MAG: dUTP diphosphatase [Parcubacteria group bacterium]|nr:dUTP diphosphatase [Parcubacteria group bacterium]|tara:strand:+ start:23503 stop:24210 length:708 start_codon:yes stop_codon:yes gene_type:complete
MITESKIIEMLELQNLMNEKVDKDWRKKDNDWLFAASVEAVEMIDHIGWKWWKKQHRDIKQAKMELIDIWHFALSYFMTVKLTPTSEEKDIGDIAKEICTDIRYFIDGKRFEKSIENNKELNFVGCVKGFMHHAGSQIGFPMYYYLYLLRLCDMSYSELYLMYIGKNMLNLFRQDKGYNEGFYQKIWSGKEDNEHLSEILSNIDTSDKDIQVNITYELEERYICHLASEMAGHNL